MSLKSTEQVTSLTTQLESEKAKLIEHEKLVQVRNGELTELQDKLKLIKDSSNIAMKEQITVLDKLKANNIS